MENKLVSELCEMGKQKTESQGRIDYDFGQALSDAYFDAYFDALHGTEIESAEKLIQFHFRKAKNERLRILKPREFRGVIHD